jgi:hypothetical protein
MDAFSPAASDFVLKDLSMFWMMPQPLLAAGFDWLEAVLPLLFLFLWIISQVAAVVRRVTRGAGRAGEDDDDEDEAEIDVTELFREVRNRNGSRRCHGCGTTFAAPAAAHAPCPECGLLTAAEDDAEEVEEKRSSADSLDDEIAAFLKQFQQDPPEKRQPAALPVPPPVPLQSVRLPASPQQQQRTPIRSSLRSPTRSAATTGNVSGINQHVHEVFDKGLAHLPEGVVENPWTDLEQGADLAQDSDREQGAVGEVRLGAAGQPIDYSSLAAVLANPISLRQAVVLREVLERPTERWQ